MVLKETIQISIDGKKLIFDKHNDPVPVDFNTSDDESNVNNVRIELGLAKFFHKVLKFIKDDPDIFQQQEFELLGTLLSMIIFGKPGDPRGPLMRDTLRSLKAGYVKCCRIILSFDVNSGVANLPWEYILYKFRDSADSYYLSASNDSKCQVIRRFPGNMQACEHPRQDRLFIILLMNVRGNSDVQPNIGSMVTEVDNIIKLFEKLQEDFPDKIVMEPEVLQSDQEPCSLEEIQGLIKETVTRWKDKYGYEPAYIVHYVGHSRLDNQVGKLAAKPGPGKKPDWISDRVFASLFDARMLKVRKPSAVFFIACDSAKIGVIENTLRGVAYEFTRLGIPAVVGMQNEINTRQSCAFYYKVYESILKGEDMADAVTNGRDHLGMSHTDFMGEELQPVGEPYKNNYFGSPVLFITTDEPIIMVKLEEEQVTEFRPSSGETQSLVPGYKKAGKTMEPVSGSVSEEHPKPADSRNAAPVADAGAQARLKKRPSTIADVASDNMKREGTKAVDSQEGALDFRKKNESEEKDETMKDDQ